jgi:hypothetical protein
MLTMTTRVKFADATADEGYTEVFRKSLNLEGRGSVLEGRTRKQVETTDPEGRALELWAQDLRAEVVPMAGSRAVGSVAERTTQRLMEQDALSEMLEEMSLSTLLYYVLAGEGRSGDETS